MTYSGQEGRESVLIPLVRTGVLNDAVEVILDPLHITADPNDYTLTPDNGLITFRSDETIKYLTVSLIDDGLVEGRERLGFQLIPLSAPVRVDLNQRVFLDIFDSSSTFNCTIPYSWKYWWIGCIKFVILVHSERAQ